MLLARRSARSAVALVQCIGNSVALERVPFTFRAHTAATRAQPLGVVRGAPLVARSCSTFVSAHYDIEESAVTEYLQRKKLVCRTTATHYIIKLCPFCHETHGKSDNMWKCYVSRQQGCFKCHRCGSQGSFFEFKRKLGDIRPASPLSGPSPGAALPRPDQAEARSYIAALQTHPELLQKITSERGLSADTLRRYGVGATTQQFFVDGEWKAEECVSFPWLVHEDGAWVIQRLKFRGVSNKRLQRLQPKGGGWGLFGLHTVPEDADAVVLTEGEYDAMAVAQATGLPAVSLPNGAHSLPPDVLPLLERFSKIYLWMDNDVPGQEGAINFAVKLGRRRCLLVAPDKNVSSNPKDANEALLMGCDLRALIDAAQPMPHQHILTFGEMREEIVRELLEPETARGVQGAALPSLTSILKGHRRGELTVFTGPTGSGKTTLLSQLSLDLCQHGVNTLWGSFELKNSRLMKKMLTQFASCRLEENMGQFEGVADNFSQLPLYFLRFFGTTDVDQVIDAMEHAVYAYDVSHVILDNLQFMTSGLARLGMERFEYQERALEKFRHFASSKNVHVTLVIHPRKEPEDQRLGLASIFGTAKATQEADNVIILQVDPIKKKKYLEVKKNRFDGDLGIVPLRFNPETYLMSEPETQAPPQPSGPSQSQSNVPVGSQAAINDMYPFGSIVMG